MDENIQPGRYVSNVHLQDGTLDRMFHLNLTAQPEQMRLFSHVKFVLVGGSPVRMTSYAEFLKSELADVLPDINETELVNLTGKVDRYVLYKVGPILIASHGIGVPSMSILLHEIFKVLFYARASDVKIFRLGTSGGLGLQPGTLVVATEGVNPEGNPVYEQFICGKRRTRPTKLDANLAAELLACSSPDDDFQIISGKTMCGDDFYEAQGRLDGAICDYTLEDKKDFLNRLHVQGVRNIEMECTAFAALTSAVNLPGAVVCVTLLDRLINDLTPLSHDEMKKIEFRPIVIAARYIKNVLKNNNKECL